MATTTLIEDFLSLEKPKIVDSIQRELDSGKDPFAILEESQRAMEEIGKKFQSGEYFIAELIYASEIFKAISPMIQGKIADSAGQKKFFGSIVFGTPKGDLHDLGKNIVITFMKANGFEVHDLGVDVPPIKFIEKIRETKANIIAMSGLITPVFFAMKSVNDLLRENGLREKTYVIVGGPILSELVVKKIGADAFGRDPVEGVNLCKAYITYHK